MNDYSIAEARANLSALVSQVERGEAVTLTRRGKPVARLVPLGQPGAKPKLDLEVLQRFRAGLPRTPVNSAAMIGDMRDETDSG